MKKLYHGFNITPKQEEPPNAFGAFLCACLVVLALFLAGVL